MGGLYFLIPFALFTLWSSLPMFDFLGRFWKRHPRLVDYPGVLAQVTDPSDGGAATRSGCVELAKISLSRAALVEYAALHVYGSLCPAPFGLSSGAHARWHLSLRSSAL